MPFAIAGVPIVPVFHLGAASGETTPFWDQKDEFGDTNLLVRLPEEGRSLARALGSASAVLMNRHGATVVGGDIRELVSRSIFMCQNATYQLQASLLGKVDTLSPGEVRLASTLNALPNVTGRTWEYWTMRLADAGRLPPTAVRASDRQGPGKGRQTQTAPLVFGFPPPLAAGEIRRALLHEGAHALGIVRIEARLALEFALEIELCVEIVLPGCVECALDQREPERRRGSEVQAELVRLAHQFDDRERPSRSCPRARPSPPAPVRR